MVRNLGVQDCRLPKRVAAVHAVVADQRIHQRVLKRVPHVQGAGHIGRRQHDRIRRAFAAGLEQSSGFPIRIPLGFNGLRVEGFV